MLPPLYENCYIVFHQESRAAVLIDPAVQDSRIDDFIRQKNLKIKAILNTHGHSDHIGANSYYSGRFGVPICAHKDDLEFFPSPPDKYLKDGDILEFDGFIVKVLHTPGHTPGSICFLINDYLFSGDTLFKNDIGKVWAEYGHKLEDVRKRFIKCIRQKLLGIPGQTRVCPGHGKTTWIADEKANNPFFN
jgi:glyoxylase-like metal-dependent hydrolase (beta-lactamase superfamily II)